MKYACDLSHEQEGIVVNRNKPQRARNIRPPMPIVVTNTISGETKHWVSSEEFAKHLGVTKNTLQCRLNRHANVWNEYKVEYRYPSNNRSSSSEMMR
jgi:hypothetical protein